MNSKIFNKTSIFSLFSLFSILVLFISEISTQENNNAKRTSFTLQDSFCNECLERDCCVNELKVLQNSLLHANEWRHSLEGQLAVCKKVEEFHTNTENALREIQREKRTLRDQLQSFESMLLTEKKCIDSASGDAYLTETLVQDMTKFWSEERKQWESERQRLNSELEQLQGASTDSSTKRKPTNNNYNSEELRKAQDELKQAKQEITQLRQHLKKSGNEQHSQHGQQTHIPLNLSKSSNNGNVGANSNENDSSSLLQLNAFILVLALSFNFMRRVWLSVYRDRMSGESYLLIYRVWYTSRDLLLITLALLSYQNTIGIEIFLSCEIGFDVAELLYKNPWQYSFEYVDLFIPLQQLIATIIAFSCSSKHNFQNLAFWLLVIDLFLLVRNLFSFYQEYTKTLGGFNIDQNYAVVRLFVLGILLVSLDGDAWLQMGLFVSLIVFGLELIHEFQKTAAAESASAQNNNQQQQQRSMNHSADSYQTPQKLY